MKTTRDRQTDGQTDTAHHFICLLLTEIRALYKRVFAIHWCRTRFCFPARCGVTWTLWNSTVTRTSGTHWSTLTSRRSSVRNAREDYSTASATNSGCVYSFGFSFSHQQRKCRHCRPTRNVNIRPVPNILFIFYLVRIVGQIVYRIECHKLDRIRIIE